MLACGAGLLIFSFGLIEGVELLMRTDELFDKFERSLGAT
jgi:hypothetical protein